MREPVVSNDEEHGAVRRRSAIWLAMLWLAILVLALTLFSPSAGAETHRDSHQRALFMKAHPCPANGNTRGRCLGYVVDHVRPLCAGGADHPENMQWQTVADAKKKDRLEALECRKKPNH
jgi:hypothetical protein